jgi:hypothetical protein
MNLLHTFTLDRLADSLNALSWQLLAVRVPNPDFLSPVASSRSISPSPVPSPDSLAFWRDPAWQSIGVIVAVVLGLLTLWLAWKQFQKKALTYEVLSNENIVQIANTTIGNDLEIFYRKVPVKNLTLIVLKFTNSGNTEIRSSDYERAITISFGDNACVLGDPSVKSSPSNLLVKAGIDSTQKKVSIESVLLNRQDNFTLQVFVDHFQEFVVDGRIAGVKAIKESQRFELSSLINVLDFAFFAFVALVVFFFPVDYFTKVILCMGFAFLYKLFRRP